MSDNYRPKVAIIDYQMGNVFSVRNACNSVGLHAEVTSEKKEVINADAVILPGVGAFGDAMKILQDLDLIEIIKNAAFTKPFVGICLGMQLLMNASYEFGYHEGLGVINGDAVRFENFSSTMERAIKVPHIGWNRINRARGNSGGNNWETSLLKGLRNQEFMYFVHSYYVRPEDPGLVVSVTNYGGIEFCSTLCFDNIFACQFHPERSGAAGLEIYRNLKDLIRKVKA